MVRRIHVSIIDTVFEMFIRACSMSVLTKEYRSMGCYRCISLENMYFLAEFLLDRSIC